jgi:MATE family multidrug resistance protein
MFCAGFVFLAIPSQLVRIFTTDAAVLGTGVTLLYVAACFQLVDGVQVVCTGVLRGVGDTRTPMLMNLAGHWGLGLPAGYSLCFFVGWGTVGLWTGLSLGLAFIAFALLWVWARKVRRLPRTLPATASATDAVSV